jgi:hypothetical protein
MTITSVWPSRLLPRSFGLVTVGHRAVSLTEGIQLATEIGDTVGNSLVLVLDFAGPTAEGSLSVSFHSAF